MFHSLDNELWGIDDPVIEETESEIKNENNETVTEPSESENIENNEDTTVAEATETTENPIVDTEKPKNKKWVLVVVCISVLFAMFGLAALISCPKTNLFTTTDANKSDSTTIVLHDAGENTTTDTSANDTVSIADNAQKFNVGIILSAPANSMTTTATNSLASEGSGIIMGPDEANEYTYILTCAHVISSAAKYKYSMTVQDYTGNTYDAILVGLDEKTDIGVIKVKGTDFTSANFANSTEALVGQTVYAIGNPGGTEFFGSFTNGMISAIDRPINSENGYEMKCIQHTTPINSGNSGGALMNQYGQVIGINSSKIVSTGYEGMAFAIPITEAKPIIDNLIAYGYVKDRPKLGISYVSTSSYNQYAMIVAINKLPSESLIIANISEDSSLANSKVKAGDMIIEVDGEKMTDSDVLIEKIQNGKIGDTLELSICRINSDYSLSTFKVKATLVEDKGSSN